MNIAIEVDSKQLERAMRHAPVKVTAGLTKWVTETSYRVERRMKQELDDNTDTGRLQSSVTPTFGFLRAEVKPSAKYAINVNDGRRPGSKMPPYKEGSPLNSWARRRGIPPFLVARSIAKKGIKPDKFVDKTYKAVKPSAEREGNRILGEIVRSI